MRLENPVTRAKMYVSSCSHAPVLIRGARKRVWNGEAKRPSRSRGGMLELGPATFCERELLPHCCGGLGRRQVAQGNAAAATAAAGPEEERERGERRAGKELRIRT